MYDERRKSSNYGHNSPKWLLVPREGDILKLTLTHICTHTYIYMHSVFPFQLFDYFVDAVIVRLPLISSIYSPAMPEGHLGKFLQTLSIYQDGRQA